MDDSAARSKPPCFREDAVALVRTLREAGHIAYFAGGCVRDLLMGFEPKDYDVATSALPQTVRSLFKNTQAVGQAFGVVLVRLGRSVIEVATFRSDGKYLDGRRPSEVQFTTAEEDAKRRDFTINGLFYDPIDERVLDFVGGREDLLNKTLRAIGEPDARFEEDHLRLMRAVRFAARFQLAIEPHTRAAIVHHAPQLARISPERIGEELRLFLTPRTRPTARDLLSHLGLLPVILRFLPDARHTETRPASLFAAVSPGAPISFGLALAALTLECRIAPGETRDWQTLLSPDAIRRSVQACRKALKISNDESDLMAGALNLAPLLQATSPSLATVKRFLAQPTSPDARRLLSALRTVSSDTARIDSLEAQFAELDEIDVAPPPLVTGDDLTTAGFSPGPIFKRVLDTVYDAQLEDRVTSKEDAMTLAMRLATQ